MKELFKKYPTEFIMGGLILALLLALIFDSNKFEAKTKSPTPMWAATQFSQCLREGGTEITFYRSKHRRWIAICK